MTIPLTTGIAQSEIVMIMRMSFRMLGRVNVRRVSLALGPTHWCEAFSRSFALSSLISRCRFASQASLPISGSFSGAGSLMRTASQSRSIAI